MQIDTTPRAAIAILVVLGVMALSAWAISAVLRLPVHR